MESCAGRIILNRHDVPDFIVDCPLALRVRIRINLKPARGDWSEEVGKIR
jgi:hypothetical protein